MLSTEVQRLPSPGPPGVRLTGEADQLRELYESHAADLFRMAYRLTGSRADAEDVVQEVFLGLPEALRGYGGRGAVGAWIRKVASRVALQKLRRRSRRKEVPLESAAERATLRNAEASLGEIDVQRALLALPPRLRSVLVLKELEGYSHEEIGQMLGIRPGASKVRLHRAREILRDLLRSAT